MCLLTVVPKGVNKYSNLILEGLEIASKTNQDGAGYSFKRNSTKKVYISKGYQDVQDLIKAIKAHNLKPEDELMIHQRIGNKGAKSVEMNHPFVVSEYKNEILLNHKYVNKPTMAHNGTFHTYSKFNSELSDTFWIINDLLYNKDLLNILKTDLDFFKKMLDTKLGTNKLCFLFPNEDTNLITIGDFKEVEGVLFSNDSYKDKSVRNVGGVNLPVQKSFFSSEDLGDDDDDIYDTYYPAGINPNTFGSNYGKAAVRPSTQFTASDYTTASPLKDDIIIKDGGLSFDCPITGVTFKLYMDLWIPNKYKTTSQLLAVRYNPTKFNFMDFIFTGLENDASTGVQNGVHYELISFDRDMKVEGEGIHVFKRKFGTGIRDKKLIYVPAYEIPRLMTSKPLAEKFPKYQGYYRLLQNLQASKNILKKLNKVLDPINYKDKGSYQFKGVNYNTPSALSLYQLLSIKNLYPKTYMAELSKKSMVVFN